MDDDIADIMQNVIAFVQARYRDDLEGARAVVEGMEFPVDMVIGLADFCLALIKTIARIVGVSEELFIETLGKQSVLMTGGTE